MKAIIIGAGRGTRMMPETEYVPKCLMEGINGQRVLDWIQRALQDGGVDDIAFIGGYRLDQVRQAYPDLRYHENRDWENNNVLESLMTAQQEMNAAFIATYSDILYGSDLVKRLIESKADIAVVIDKDWRRRYIGRTLKTQAEAEKALTRDGHVLEVGRHIPGENADGEFIGLAKFSRTAAHMLSQRYDQIRDLYRESRFHTSPNLRLAYLSDMLQELIEMGVEVEAVEVRAEWAELDTLQDLEWARTRLNGKISAGGAREFWAVRAERYERLDWTSRKGYLDNFVAVGEFGHNDNVLDIGTGTGIVAHAVAPLVAHVTGIDNSPDMIHHAAASQLTNVLLEEGDVRHLQYADNSFDRITARMVFHHLLDGGEQAMLECFRVLKPGGLIVLSEGVPPDTSLREWYTSMFALKEARLTFFEDDLVSLLQSGGFTVERVIEHITPHVSIRNWLENSGLPKKRQEMIMQMHRDLDEHGKQCYNMQITEDDILCDFKFLILVGCKAPADVPKEESAE